MALKNELFSYVCVTNIEVTVTTNFTPDLQVYKMATKFDTAINAICPMVHVHVGRVSIMKKVPPSSTVCMGA